MLANTIDPYVLTDTKHLCRRLNLQQASIIEEWKKAFVNGRTPDV